jgi:hypothetical protein
MQKFILLLKLLFSGKNPSQLLIEESLRQARRVDQKNAQNPPIAPRVITVQDLMEGEMINGQRYYSFLTTNGDFMRLRWDEQICIKKTCKTCGIQAHYHAIAWCMAINKQFNFQKLVESIPCLICK